MAGKPILKKILFIAGIIIGIALIAIIAIISFGNSKVNELYEIQAASVTIPTDSASLALGQHLANVQGCTDCHGADLSGKIMIDEPPMGKISAANLTGGRGGIGSRYTDNDWVKAIRHGVRQDNKSLIIMPSAAYTELSREDLSALIAYIKSVPPVDNVLPAREVGIIAKVICFFSPRELLSAQKVDHQMTFSEKPMPGVTVEYGDYLANTCRYCHGQNLAGGLKIGGPDVPPSANLTPHPTEGLKNWSRADFTKAISEGIRPDGSHINPEMPLFGKALSEDEISALWLYLQSLPPIASAK
jgi:cytochrome c553